MITGNNARLLRWSLRLSEFDFSIEQRSGTQIRHVDALRRHVQAVHTSKIILKDRVKVEQASEKFCNSIEVGKFMGKSEYFYDGVIYRRRMNGEHQLVVPKTLAKEVIELNYDTIYAAIPGRKRTGNSMHTLLLAQNEAERRKLCQGM
jgi:hypothetical protein